MKEDIPWQFTMTLEEYFYKALELGYESRPTVLIMRKYLPEVYERALKRWEMNAKAKD